MPGFRERVIEIVDAVPSGCVVTYGQVALLAGAPRAARQVGMVLNGLRESEPVPWQRVINSAGRLSTYKIGAGDLQRALLEAEGVEFDGEGRIDLSRFRWEPEPVELDEGGHEHRRRSRMMRRMEQMAGELELARALIRAESPSGNESPAAEVLLGAFRDLGYDQAYLDDAGNALGVFRRGDGPTVMLNGHLDTVAAGDPALWEYPPFSGTIADGRLWGRGSCDMKGAVACMALAGRDAVDAGFSGTLIVAGVVQEEVGGLGARHLTEHLLADVVVLGEPSDLELKLGHRGRVEVAVKLSGRIAHAAKASLGENALYRAAHYLGRLEACVLPAGGPLGASTATPTGITVWPPGANVVPGEAEITIDYRFIADDPPDEIVARLEELDREAQVVIGEEEAASENGEVSYSFPRINPAYLAPESGWQVDTARSVIRNVLQAYGREFREGVWWFSTDAPYLAARGAVVVGFGPGEPERAHTTEEAVPVDHLAVARAVYAELALSYSHST